MAGKTFWRISRQDLDKLMTTLEVVFVRLSECALGAGAQLPLARATTSTIHYCLRGVGHILIDDEPPIRLTPHTLVIVPPGRTTTIFATQHAAGLRCTSKRCYGGFTPGSSQRHSVGDGDPTLVLACASFRANYGPGLDMFASMPTAIVESFDVHDQLDQVMAYAMAELAAQNVGGGAMSAALLKLVLLALLRRCLVSTNAWVERFSILSDPPIARAFAEMASHPSAAHTVRSLSQSVGLSRSAFTARFSAAFGESPMSLLRRVRMRHAANLLAANALSIDQVAMSAGYQSRSSFTRTFRKFYGSDPSEYRATAQRASSDNETWTEEALERFDAA